MFQNIGKITWISLVLFILLSMVDVLGGQVSSEILINLWLVSAVALAVFIFIGLFFGDSKSKLTSFYVILILVVVYASLMLIGSGFQRS